ncbi:MAG TPA: tetratricopeptide repeat protein [Drouetiella sp.]|jgi:tetratricopeptide (TPR) repeat protein
MTTTDLYESEALVDQASLAAGKRQFSRAESLFEQAAKRREKAIGEDVSVAQILDELGAVQIALGKYADAEKTLTNALSMAEKALYAGHGLLVPFCQHLADLFILQSKWAEAEPYAARALEISEKTLSGEHRTTLQNIQRLGMVQSKLDKQAEAEKTLTKALKHIDSPLGPLEEFKYELAMLFQAQGKTAEAEKAYKEAIEGLEYRSALPRLAQCLTSYAEFLKANNRAGETEKLLERAKTAREASRDWHHSPDIFPSTLLRA